MQAGRRSRLTTASHLVGHLARGIESGMRQLLTSMVPRDRLDALPVESGSAVRRGRTWWMKSAH